MLNMRAWNVGEILPVSPMASTIRDCTVGGWVTLRSGSTLSRYICQSLKIWTCSGCRVCRFGSVNGVPKKRRWSYPSGHGFLTDIRLEPSPSSSSCSSSESNDFNPRSVSARRWLDMRLETYQAADGMKEVSVRGHRQYVSVCLPRPTM